MSNEMPPVELLMNEEERKKANEDLMVYLQGTLADSRREVVKLQNKLASTYWIVVILSIIMFILGIVLLSVPVVAAFRGVR